VGSDCPAQKSSPSTNELKVQEGVQDVATLYVPWEKHAPYSFSTQIETSPVLQPWVIVNWQEKGLAEKGFNIAQLSKQFPRPRSQKQNYY
jgi:hypothetical protein